MIARRCGDHDETMNLNDYSCRLDRRTKTRIPLGGIAAVQGDSVSLV